jgi:hypothetical protein
MATSSYLTTLAEPLLKDSKRDWVKKNNCLQTISQPRWFIPVFLLLLWSPTLCVVAFGACFLKGGQDAVIFPSWTTFLLEYTVNPFITFFILVKFYNLENEPTVPKLISKAPTSTALLEEQHVAIPHLTLTASKLAWLNWIVMAVLSTLTVYYNYGDALATQGDDFIDPQHHQRTFNILSLMSYLGNFASMGTIVSFSIPAVMIAFHENERRLKQALDETITHLRDAEAARKLQTLRDDLRTSLLQILKASKMISGLLLTINFSVGLSVLVAFVDFYIEIGQPVVDDANAQDTAHGCVYYLMLYFIFLFELLYVYGRHAVVCEMNEREFLLDLSTIVDIKEYDYFTGFMKEHPFRFMIGNFYISIFQCYMVAVFVAFLFCGKILFPFV